MRFKAGCLFFSCINKIHCIFPIQYMYTIQYLETECWKCFCGYVLYMYMYKHVNSSCGEFVVVYRLIMHALCNRYCDF